MKYFLLLLVTASALANGPWDRKFQDIRLPTQEIFEHFIAAHPVVAQDNYVSGNRLLNNGSTVTYSAFTGQPDYPRNLVLSTSSTSSALGAGTAVITGLNIYGKSISENFSVSSGTGNTITGNKAFKSISSITLPAATGSAVFRIGVGSKLGVHRCMDDVGDYVFSKFNGAYETTRGTMAVSSSAIESNTFIPNGTMDGAKAVEAFFLENFRCYPN